MTDTEKLDLPMRCIDCERWMYTEADWDDHDCCRRAHEDYVERWS